MLVGLGPQNAFAQGDDAKKVVNSPTKGELKGDPVTRPKAEILSRRLSSPIEFAPWSASLIIAETSSRSNYFCNAVLIDSSWALTAAHCIDQVNVKNFAVAFGNANVGKSKIVAVERSFVYPYKLEGEGRDDSRIALLKLKRSTMPNINESIYASPFASLPNDANVVAARKASVVGWGSLHEDVSPSDQLVKVDTRIVEQSLCNSPNWYSGKITKDTFCSQSTLEGLDVCAGFSGAGLIEFRNGEPIVVGLVAWGEGCGEPNKPTVYINVGRFRSWIKKSMR